MKPRKEVEGGGVSRGLGGERRVVLQGFRAPYGFPELANIAGHDLLSPHLADPLLSPKSLCA